MENEGNRNGGREKYSGAAVLSFRGLNHFCFLGSWFLMIGICCSAERRPGAIKTTDGVEMKGEIWFNNGEVKIYEGEDASGGRFVKVLQEEIASITFSTKSASMERPWRFKNAGSDEKEYLDGQYPLIELKSETKLKSGQILKGHLSSVPVYVRVQNRESPEDYDTKKFFLKYQYKGEVGQAVKDVSYVTQIVFDGADSTPTGKGAIAGSVKDFGKIEQVAAFGIKRQRAYEGKPGKDKLSFRIENLPDDTYDIAVLTETGVYLGLSDLCAITGDDVRPLEANDIAALNEQVKKFRDFFDDQRVLAVKGNRECAKTIVFQVRHAEIYDNASLKGAEIHRIDIWNWHMRQTEWSIDASSRANLLRYNDPKGKDRDVKLVAKLGALPVTVDVKTIDFSATDVGESILQPAKKEGGAK